MIRTQNQQKHLTILANDPSLTGWGWAIIRNEHVLEADCIKTSPDYKKKRIRKSDDTIRRVQEINTVLLQIIRAHSVDFIVAEAPHGSQSATAAVMIGMVTGIMQTLSDALMIPIEWFSEEDAKKCVLGKRAAAKEEMIKAIDQKYDVPWKDSKYRNEAIADALAIYHTAMRNSTTLKMLT